MWAYDTTFYQIFPMGFCGAPFENDGNLNHRILKVKEWVPHLVSLGIGAIYFSPVFESDSHGYNTRDYKKIDTRLGTNEDFLSVCDMLHANGIKVVIDGVFNHVGRGFGPFQDVVRNREQSRYKDWFYINFGGNSNYNDGLWYEGWEGHYDLVKLNLRHPEVKGMIFDAVRYWVEYFGIDGIRLDVAYSLDHDFLRELRHLTDELGRNNGKEILLLGELLHGDYKQFINDSMLHSATNYQCYKGLYSSFNSMNMFEIIHSLIRQFGSDPWCVYRGLHLLSFVDNHDVSRVATILNDKNHIPLIYTMMFGMPGIPCIYYGSEWGAQGDKKDGDPGLRPLFDKPEWNALTDHIKKLNDAKKACPALSYGDFKSIVLTNRQCVFERCCDGSRVLVGVNADSQPYYAHFNGEGLDMISGQVIGGNGVDMPPYSSFIIDCGRMGGN